jgi:CBS domain-containing protein
LSNNSNECVVIVDDLNTRKPLGIITESDIKKIIGKLDRHQLHNPIKHHRSRPLITLSAQATVAEAMRLMTRKFEQNSRQLGRC